MRAVYDHRVSDCRGIVGDVEMTDQEAFRLIEENLQLLRDAYHWGEIRIEVNEGEVKRIRLLVNVKPKNEENEGGRMKNEDFTTPL